LKIYLFFKGIIFLLVTSILYSNDCTGSVEPPFTGTIFIDPNIITKNDPTSFTHIKFSGKKSRIMFDRRVDDWIESFPLIFLAYYDDGYSVEVQVNPEFESSEISLEIAKKYATIIGRIPNSLRANVETVWIHKGMKPFGGGNNNLLIHTDWSEEHYESQGILEEAFIHEAAHTSLDELYSNDLEWKNAQRVDCQFISFYALENSLREDVAESYLAYFAVRYASKRISKKMINTIENTMPERIKFFDKQKQNIYPFISSSND
jgi:hypothetical protein